MMKLVSGCSVFIAISEVWASTPTLEHTMRVSKTFHGNRTGSTLIPKKLSAFYQTLQKLKSAANLSSTSSVDSCTVCNNNADMQWCSPSIQTSTVAQPQFVPVLGACIPKTQSCNEVVFGTVGKFIADIAKFLPEGFKYEVVAIPKDSECCTSFKTPQEFATGDCNTCMDYGASSGIKVGWCDIEDDIFQLGMCIREDIFFVCNEAILPSNFLQPYLPPLNLSAYFADTKDKCGKKEPVPLPPVRDVCEDNLDCEACVSEKCTYCGGKLTASSLPPINILGKCISGVNQSCDNIEFGTIKKLLPPDLFKVVPLTIADKTLCTTVQWPIEPSKDCERCIEPLNAGWCQYTLEDLDGGICMTGGLDFLCSVQMSTPFNLISKWIQHGGQCPLPPITTTTTTTTTTSFTGSTTTTTLFTGSTTTTTLFTGSTTTTTPFTGSTTTTTLFTGSTTTTTPFTGSTTTTRRALTTTSAAFSVVGNSLATVIAIAATVLSLYTV